MSLRTKAEVIDISKDGNCLIDNLPTQERSAVLDQCERIDLAFGTILCEAGEPFRYAYFPLSGNISMVTAFAGHEPFETEGIGRDGMLGAALILNANCAPQRGIVQTRCLALRIDAQKMRAASQEHPALFRLLQRYLTTIIAEQSQAIGCIRFHDVGKRLARVLLITHDRAQTNHLPLTHQLLADMLGVQRGAVTLAASKLQREGSIRYSRGKIEILDRQKLEGASCECYSESIDHFASLYSPAAPFNSPYVRYRTEPARRPR